MSDTGYEDNLKVGAVVEVHSKDGPRNVSLKDPRGLLARAPVDNAGSWPGLRLGGRRGQLGLSLGMCPIWVREHVAGHEHIAALLALYKRNIGRQRRERRQLGRRSIRCCA